MKLTVTTHAQTEFVDITSKVQGLIRKTSIASGLCMVYVPHTTAAVTINESADPAVATDMLMVLNRIVELLNLSALVAALSIGFFYVPHPGHFSSIENFCYYLHLTGGSACDFFDFLYESAAKPSEDKL